MHPAGSTPRYASVADALRRDIAAGRYGVGSLLPPESELCTAYGVSRHTVREAARRLVALGMISRHPGIGTRVRATEPAPRFAASLGSMDELLQYTEQTRLVLLDAGDVQARGALAEELRCADGAPWFRLHTLRYAEELAQPISVTDIYVPPAYRGIADHLGQGSVAVYRLIEQHFGARIVEARQDIGGLPIPADAAALLGVEPGGAGLEVLRRYLGADGHTISLSRNVYPAGRFRLSTSWRLSAD